MKLGQIGPKYRESWLGGTANHLKSYHQFVSIEALLKCNDHLRDELTNFRVFVALVQLVELFQSRDNQIWKDAFKKDKLSCSIVDFWSLPEKPRRDKQDFTAVEQYPRVPTSYQKDEHTNH